MKLRHAVAAIVVTLTMTAAVYATSSVKADLFPGEGNWHRYGFVVVPDSGNIAVRQSIVLSWDAPEASISLFVFNMTDPSEPRLVAASVGSDRTAVLDIGLLSGSHQLVITGLHAATHYHMSSTYSNDEIFSRLPNLFTAAEVIGQRRQAEAIAPFLALRGQ